MKSSLSLVVITKNAEELLEKTLESVKGLVDEIVLVDDYSKDKTIEIAKTYVAKTYLHHERDLGKQRKYAVSKATSEWVLILDADEWLSNELFNEIRRILSSLRSSRMTCSAYYIPFQTHFLGRPLHYGGEHYKKLILFRKDSVAIKPALVHEKYEVTKGKAGILKNKILHYSYRSLGEMFAKFTDYGFRDAEQKIKNGEKTSLRKIFLYPIHMFWARFVEDKGYRDGIFRILLDIGFAYMEFLTYFLMLFKKR